MLYFRATFSSVRPEEIQEEGKSWGVRALKGYLQFAKTGSWLLPTASQTDCDSEFERWVLQALRTNRYEAIAQLGFAGYRIDIAVRHPKQPGTFLCGVECDGATYHAARSVRERDRLRQEVLERLGWKIYRIGQPTGSETRDCKHITFWRTSAVLRLHNCCLILQRHL